MASNLLVPFFRDHPALASKQMMNDSPIDKSLHTETPVPFVEDILSTLRHQLGNSVNALKVTLDVLHENFDLFNDDKKREYLERAQEVLARQQTMVDAMRSYSSVNVNDQKPIEFLSFWEQFLATLRQRTEKISLIQNLPSGPHHVMGSPIAIQNVLMQLVENALDAVEGIENPRIELSVSDEAERLRIGVTDNGCGIKQKDMSKIFVPLFTTKPKRKGLGLSIALKLMAQMGGRLEIAPLAEGGTVATIWLQRVGGENHGQAVHQ
jgi:two-component system, NtrC family, C4-dicarboxylate transport sensor histidine kinase DctB